MRRLLIVLAVLCLLVQGSSAQIIMRPHPRRSSGAGSTLMNGLVAFWNLDEESGTRYDEIGNNDLTDINTVLYSTGKINNAADIELDNYEYLNCNDNADLSFEDESLTIAGWFNMESKPVAQSLFGKSGFVSKLRREYAILYYNVSSENELRFYVGSGSDLAYDYVTSSNTSYNNSTWYFVCAWFNYATDSLYIQINGDTPDRVVSIVGVKNGNNSFNIGSQEKGVNRYDGLIDLVGVWGRCPQSSNGYAMADSIYNGGAGWCP